MKNQNFKHGTIRGLENVISQRVNTQNQFEGKFGRLFPHLQPADHSFEDLIKLGSVNENGNIGMTAAKDAPPTPENKPDDEENSGISAGYTYLGQFIDHDLTFDPSTLAQQKSDPRAIIDYRTPRFDLDNLYGRGPDDQPYLYDFQDDGTIKMLLGKRLFGNDDDKNTKDLPRVNSKNGRKFALIGDKRNDENVIVSQLHGMFLRFHNSILHFHSVNGLTTDFEEIQKEVKFHYQWLVLNDFLPTIIGKELLFEICPHLKKKTDPEADLPNLKFYNYKLGFMPVEFSVAAYRFGHSMVRPIYRLNQHNDRKIIFPDLLAFGEFDDGLAIDWRLFFDFGNKPDPKSTHRIQRAYKIDTSLVNPLGNLPKPITGETPPSLATLNLLRGLKLKLPSGQDVAKALNLKPLTDDQLRVGKANEDGFSTDPNKQNHKITEVSEKFAGNAPLWFYILAEAQYEAFKKANGHFNNETPITLGPVGGRIVGEVFVGILLADKTSILHNPKWKPKKEFVNSKGHFGIVELIKQAHQA